MENFSEDYKQWLASKYGLEMFFSMDDKTILVYEALRPGSDENRGLLMFDMFTLKQQGEHLFNRIDPSGDIEDELDSDSD